MKYAQHHSQTLQSAGTDWEKNRVFGLSIPGIHCHAKTVGTDQESSTEHCHHPTGCMITQEYPARFLHILIYQYKCSCGRLGYVQHSAPGRQFGQMPMDNHGRGKSTPSQLQALKHVHSDHQSKRRGFLKYFPCSNLEHEKHPKQLKMVIWKSVSHTTSSIKQMSRDVSLEVYIIFTERKCVSYYYYKCNFKFFSMGTKLNPKVYSKIPNYLNTNPGN